MEESPIFLGTEFSTLNGNDVHRITGKLTWAAKFADGFNIILFKQKITELIKRII